MTLWFGASWGAPICSPSEHVETPVGEACMYCDAPIEADDQGVRMPSMKPKGLTFVSVVLSAHLDCFLQTILPHGPECSRCRGLERNEHKMSCAYAKHGGDCDCPFGEQMRKLLDPKTALAEVRNIAEDMGITWQQVEDIGRRGVEHVERLKRRRAAHNPPDDSGERKA